MSRPRGAQAGFSLVEAVVSAVVLGIGMVGLINLHTSSMRGESRAIEMSRAQEVARQVADYYSTRGYEASQADAALTVCGGEIAQACTPSQSAPATAGECAFWVDRDWAMLDGDNVLDRSETAARPTGAIRVEVRWTPSTQIEDAGRIEVAACAYGQDGRAESEATSKRMVIN